MAINSYKENLINTVIDNSVSDVWDTAVLEWDIIDCSVDESCTSRCTCGKESIKYLFTIQNRRTGSVLDPIGSKCINKFGRFDFDTSVAVYEQMNKLYEAVSSGQYIVFDSGLFSRKLLEALYEGGAFEPNQWNKYNAKNDYLFLLDMFNKRSTPSEAQQRKITALIVGSIKPYIKSQIKYRQA